MDEILNTILKDTYSLAQLKHRLMILKTNLLKTFFGGTDNAPLLPQELNWLKSLPPNFYLQFNKDNVYDIFSALEKTVGKLPELTMYLTFEPDDQTLSQIGIYARKNFGSTLLLDIKLDPKLIAGTSLVWKGITKDYSVKSRLEEKKAEIFQGFKKFLR